MSVDERAVPDFDIRWHREMIPALVYPYKIPDLDWRHVDSRGHGHFWTGKDSLPTLQWVVTGTRWVGDEIDGETVDVGEWRCKLCGETIEPGQKLFHPPSEIPGLVTITVTLHGERFELTEAMFDQSLRGWRDILRRICEGDM